MREDPFPTTDFTGTCEINFHSSCLVHERFIFRSRHRADTRVNSAADSEQSTNSNGSDSVRSDSVREVGPVFGALGCHPGKKPTGPPSGGPVGGERRERREGMFVLGEGALSASFTPIYSPRGGVCAERRKNVPRGSSAPLVRSGKKPPDPLFSGPGGGERGECVREEGWPRGLLIIASRHTHLRPRFE